jgi:hypothetical protein
MSYSVIYKKIRVILDNSKLRDILRGKSLYEYGHIFSKTKRCKVCNAKDIGAL